uniref:Uncharacterized protein n=1 Tax=Vitis vinifera TaxID=29760 RepID=A5BNA5_VITVI|nr:hypothetical protein VITISV_017903 [Vitis vinifera]
MPIWYHAMHVWLARSAHLARPRCTFGSLVVHIWLTQGARLARPWCERGERLARPRCGRDACLARPQPPHLAPGV